MGREEVARLAQALGRRFDLSALYGVVSSPLRRAVETAEALRQFTSRDVVTERVIDRDYGEWAGQRPADVLAQWPTVDAAPGIEPTEAVRASSRRP